MPLKPIGKAREIKNAEISFISLVDRPANKRKFLIMKGENIMSKKQNEMALEDVQEFINQCVSQAVVQTLEACGITEQAAKGSDQIAKQYDNSGKHYLSGIIL